MTRITPDAGTCADCVREFFAPTDRRHAHPFVTCTACGPRFTIVDTAPYDRARTTMARFPMCDACRAEYDAASDRRFHAQPIACSACGPRLALTGPHGEDLGREAPILEAARILARGGIVAVKGLGGYHLACDATNDAAIARLREKKRRDAKPFAIMVASIAEVGSLARVSAEERALLESPARPIVLLDRVERSVASPLVAPGTSRLGIVLAYTPVHHLLLRACSFPLVMTSGNVTDEPIAYADDDARDRLGPLVDALLVHDRPIRVRCDDSIVRVEHGAPSMLRRARGYTPASVPLPHPLARPTLALGGHLKAAFALGMGHEAFPSHHLGDLDHAEAERAFRESLAHLAALLRIDAERVVHDLHPDYATTILAEELAKRGLERVAVQHHEAHASALLAEHGVTAEAVSVVFDGSGFGRDGTMWGGEIFVGALGCLRRAARLRPVVLVGGDRAAREGRRSAIARALEAGLPLDAIAQRLDLATSEVSRYASLATSSSTMRTMRTSSIGRLFDAVAAIVGVRAESTYEAQAAIELETVATRAGNGPALPAMAIATTDPATSLELELDPRPLIRALFEERSASDRGALAWGFHAALATAIGEACARLAEPRGARVVGLSGGVFANALLTELARRALESRGLEVLAARAIPTNDGGLAYGQLAAVAAGDAR